MNDMLKKTEESISGCIALLDFILSTLEYENNDEYLILSLRSIQYILQDAFPTK